MPLPIDTSWDALPARLRAENVEIKMLLTTGELFHLTGPLAGTEGAMITGSVEGLGEIPGEGVWSETANSAPYFERWVDGKLEIHFNLLLIEDTEFGWAATRRRFFDGCVPAEPCWFSVTTRGWGEVWVPVHRAEVNTIFEDDPTANDNNVSIHELTLAVSGDPRWRRPDFVGMYQHTNGQKIGQIRVINRGNVPAWPYFICEAPGRILLPDGPNAIITAADAADHTDFPGLLGLFKLGELLPFGQRRRREPKTVIDVVLYSDEHTLIDTDPTHRIAIDSKAPVTDGWLEWINNAELLQLLTGNAGDKAKTVMERLRGQGFRVPIPPRSEATLQVSHSRPGGRIWCVVPQRFDHAL